MKLTKHILRKLVDKFFTNKINDNEQAVLDGFVRSEYDTALDNISFTTDKEHTREAIWSTIENTINPTTKLRYLPYLNYVAAAVIVVALICVPFLRNHEKMLTYSTGAAIDSIQLADGSQIFLGANTTLEYPEQFEGKQRVVFLKTGNAFFQVHRDVSKPFMVKSEELTTQVLGTSFNVRITDSATAVTVATGKVNISNTKGSVDLLPNEKGVWANNTITKENVDDAEFKNWFKPYLSFKGVTLKSVTDLLEYKFNVRFEYTQESINDQKVNIYITPEDSLPEILNNLEFITQLKFNSNDQLITVKNN